MWTLEVHDQCMEQAIEDEQALAKARKYGNSIPRHNCQGSSVSVIVALVSAGLIIANHARTGSRSLLTRICKRLWGDGKQKEDTGTTKRKKAAAAAEARQQEVASKGSRFNFPASGSGVTASTSGGGVGATASTSRVLATTVDQSFTKEAAAVVAKTSSKSNKKKNKKKGKR